MRTEIGELSSKKEAGRHCHWSNLTTGWGYRELIGMRFPWIPRIPNELHGNRCSLRDGVSAVVGIASGTSSGRGRRLHWDDGWAFIGMTVETSSRWRLPARDRNVFSSMFDHFGWQFTFVWMMVRLRFGDGWPSFRWRFAFIWMTVHLRSDDGSPSFGCSSPSFGWRCTFVWMVHIRLMAVRLRSDDGDLRSDIPRSFGWRSAFVWIWWTLGWMKAWFCLANRLRTCKFPHCMVEAQSWAQRGMTWLMLEGREGNNEGYDGKWHCSPDPCHGRCTVGVPLPHKNHWLDEEEMRLINVFCGDWQVVRHLDSMLCGHLSKILQLMPGTMQKLQQWKWHFQKSRHLNARSLKGSKKAPCKGVSRDRGS